MAELWSNEKTPQMIKVIDQIAFQANLFALNAAVEAGGETNGECASAHGRPHAVWDAAGLIDKSVAYASTNVRVLADGSGPVDGAARLGREHRV